MWNVDAICKNNAEVAKRVTFPYVTLITENRALWLLWRERKTVHELQWSITVFHYRRLHGELGLYTYCVHSLHANNLIWSTGHQYKKCHGKQGQAVFLLWFCSVIKTQRTRFEGQKQQNPQTGWMSWQRIHKGTSSKYQNSVEESLAVPLVREHILGVVLRSRVQNCLVSLLHACAGSPEKTMFCPQSFNHRKR